MCSPLFNYGMLHTGYLVFVKDVESQDRKAVFGAYAGRIPR